MMIEIGCRKISYGRWLRHRRMAAPFDLAETVFSRRKHFLAENKCYHQILHPKIDLHTHFYGFWTTFIFHLSVYQGEIPGGTARRHQSPKAPVMYRRTPKGAQVNVSN